MASTASSPSSALRVFLLTLADAVLAGAGAVHRLGALDQAMHELLATGHLISVVDVADQRAVEIAVADMADDRRQQAEPFQIVLGLGDAIGQREIGTQTSVATTPAPGRSAFTDQ